MLQRQQLQSLESIRPQAARAHCTCTHLTSEPDAGAMADMWPLLALLLSKPLLLRKCTHRSHLLAGIPEGLAVMRLNRLNTGSGSGLLHCSR